MLQPSSLTHGCMIVIGSHSKPTQKVARCVVVLSIYNIMHAKH